MSAQVEDLDTIQPWRVGNSFSVTLRGHWQKIPTEESTTTLASDYDPYAAASTYDSDIREVVGTTNYNTVYDSFYAPVDFRLSGVTLRLPVPLAQKAQYDIQLKINGGLIEKIQIPEFEDHNMKKYTLDCDFLIYEDDFIEVSITINNVDLVTFNENNLTCAISGCVSYINYKELWADEFARVATTANIILAGPQTIDGVATIAGDVVLVKNQTIGTDDGLYVVAAGAWARDASYPTLASLEDVIIHVTEGTTNISDDSTNYTAVDDGTGTFFIGYPLIEWETGDNWYKTNIHLQNRSGNDTLQDRVYLDMVKSPMNFLFQGIRLSLFEDHLMVVEQIRERIVCLYIDILVNGRSLLTYTDFPRPMQIDTSQVHKTYDMALFNNEAGFAIRFGDSIDVRVYLRNPHTKYNGKLLNVSLYGCSPDCAVFDSPTIAVYEPCDDEPCEWKFSIVQRCEPEKLRTTDAAGNTIAPTPYNPSVAPIVAPVPSDNDYVVVNGVYVTVDGTKIYV